MPKVILCYGDSNTWGFDPATRLRFPEELRWPSVLKREIGAGHRVIAEGLNARTTVWDDPLEESRNGKTYLLPCLLSHRPIDLVVLMLGTNDLKMRFSVSAAEIGRGIGVLLDVIKRSGAGPYDPGILDQPVVRDAPAPLGGAPKVLVLSPPPLSAITDMGEMFEGGLEKSRKLSEAYRRQAELHGCAFFDAGEVATSSDLDGLHLDVSSNAALGRAVAEQARKILE